MENDRYLILLEHGPEEGIYELRTDVHVYDLMGDSIAELDELPDRTPEDRLVATAAWMVQPDLRPSVDRWMNLRKLQPREWLTPWHPDEPTILADYWLDTTTSDDTYLVFRLDRPYLLHLVLRRSVEAALDRFQDLRRAVEPPLEAAIGRTLPRATRQWLDRIHSGLDPDEGET